METADVDHRHQTEAPDGASTGITSSARHEPSRSPRASARLHDRVDCNRLECYEASRANTAALEIADEHFVGIDQLWRSQAGWPPTSATWEYAASRLPSHAAAALRRSWLRRLDALTVRSRSGKYDRDAAAALEPQRDLRSRGRGDKGTETIVIRACHVNAVDGDDDVADL